MRWECYRQPCCCGNTVQEQPKHWCFINTFLASNTKHSSTRAARGKITFFPVRLNTTVYLKKLTETFNKITLNSEDLKSQAALGASQREMLCRPWPTQGLDVQTSTSKWMVRPCPLLSLKQWYCLLSRWGCKLETWISCASSLGAQAPGGLQWW